MNLHKISLAAIMTTLVLSACSPKANETAASSQSDKNGKGIKLLNVSYDVSRDFYKEYNPLFIKEFKRTHNNEEIDIQQSHGGSSKQALSVANGLAADVVTMNQTSDIDLLVNKGLVKKDWSTRLPDSAIPFSSTTVFLVKKGNPKQIKDWSDLTKEGVKIVLSNPKTSGNGRYAFLGAYGYGLKVNQGDENKTKTFLTSLLKNVPVFENGGRAATTTFTQRNIGDVLITFENEANHVSKNLAPGQFEIVYPSYTIISDSPVSMVDGIVEKKGTQSVAQEYLKYLWSEPAQELAAKFYLRPHNPDILTKHADVFPKMESFRPNDVFGSWNEIMKKYFADGGVVDQLTPKK